MFQITRRTFNVWASLVGGMTLVAVVLSALEPHPIAPGSVSSVSSTSPGAGTDSTLFNTLPLVKPGRWTAIVVHFSGQTNGSLQTISQQAQANSGRIDSGYHFVINNGHGKPDGEIELGFRWRRQLVGDFGTGERAEWFNSNAIGICMVGNPQEKPLTNSQLRELTWLVRQLQQRLSIPAERVVVQSSDALSAESFPMSEFRAQLAQDPSIRLASGDPFVAAPAPRTAQGR